MAPEQAKGMAVDKRADIWAFGVLLYEMLTGARLFAGDTVPETLAGVLKTVIDLESLPDETPRPVRRLLRRCLERDPRNRLHDIADARLELDAIGEAGGTVEAVPPVPPRRGLVGAGIAVGVALGVALGVFGPWRSKPAPPPPSWKLSLAPPAGLSGYRTSPKISPDGRSIAYLADGKLWTQKLDGLTPRVIPKSEGASIFTWSPDGGALAFATQLLLLRTLPNGDVTQVASLQDPISIDSGGLAWTADGTLVFSTGSSGLFAVPASGGEPRPLLEPDKAHESDFHQVLALPDGKGVVFLVHRTPGGISAIDLFAGGQRRRILQEDSHGGLEGLAWAESGQLLYGVSGGGGAAWALPLDPGTFEKRGDPYLVAANVSAPSISRDGTLLLSNFASAGHHQLEIVGLDGVPRTALGDALPHVDHASFSPDGKRVAYCLLGPDSSDVWVFDVDRGSRSRLWSNANCGGIAQGISWSADGTELAVSESDKETIHILRVDGSRTERELTEGGQPVLSRDGRWLVLTRTTEKTKQDIWALPLAGGEARPLLVSEASEQQPRLSPDGRYLAYVSDETGHTEVHLCPFPEGAGRWQVSISGGEMPRWSADGRRLFYLQNDDQMMLVDIDLRGMPVLSDPRPLFSSANKRLGPSHGYDIAPDGSGFVTVELGTPEGGGGDLTLIRPWPPQNAGQ